MVHTHSDESIDHIDGSRVWRFEGLSWVTTSRCRGTVYGAALDGIACVSAGGEGWGVYLATAVSHYVPIWGIALDHLGVSVVWHGAWCGMA